MLVSPSVTQRRAVSCCGGNHVLCNVARTTLMLLWLLLLLQGGVRVCAALNGGFLPDAVRGQVLEQGLFHIADWCGGVGGLLLARVRVRVRLSCGVSAGSFCLDREETLRERLVLFLPLRSARCSSRVPNAAYRFLFTSLFLSKDVGVHMPRHVAVVLLVYFSPLAGTLHLADWPGTTVRTTRLLPRRACHR